MRCVGYRQCWEMLDGCQDQPQASDLHTLRETGVSATRQLAKRQLTWLRSMPKRQAVACEDPNAAAQVLDLIAHAVD
jgi:tRNA dimethylallyltransferase